MVPIKAGLSLKVHFIKRIEDWILKSERMKESKNRLCLPGDIFLWAEVMFVQ